MNKGYKAGGGNVHRFILHASPPPLVQGSRSVHCAFSLTPALKLTGSPIITISRDNLRFKFFIHFHSKKFFLTFFKNSIEQNSGNLRLFLILNDILCEIFYFSHFFSHFDFFDFYFLITVLVFKALLKLTFY